jgi:uncharacterized membrane protein YbhN (UPF0104 family)
MQQKRRLTGPILVTGVVVLAAATAAFATHHAQGASRLVQEIGSIDLRIAAIGLVLSGLAVVNRGLLNRAAHRAVGLDAGTLAMTRTAAVGFAAQKIVRSAGVVGLAVFVRDGRRRGHEPGSVAAACVLSAVSSFLALGALLMSAIAVLAVTGRLTGWWLAAAVGFALYAVVVSVVGLVVVRSRVTALRWWSAALSVRRRVMPRRPLGPDAEAVPSLLLDALATARSDRGALRSILFHGVMSKALGAVTLAAAVAAVGLPLSVSAAVVVYATALAASMVTIVPGGLGAVEGSTTALLVASGAPMASAALAVALFRFFDLVLPVLTGALAARGGLRSPTAPIGALPQPLALAPAA